MKMMQRSTTLKRLGQVIVRCLGCGVSWIVLGLRPGDTHICKECGRRSVIEQLAAGAASLNKVVVNP